MSPSRVAESSSAIAAAVQAGRDTLEGVPEGRVGQLMFQRALAAYPSVNLIENFKKRKADRETSVVLGGYIEGSEGYILAPPVKVLVLMFLTLRICILGLATRELLDTITGCWIYVLLFRRPAMCILHQVFHEGSHFREPHLRTVVFRLSSRCKTELFQLCILGPFLSTNLRAEPVEKIYATDASPYAAGGCVAWICKNFSYELFRVSSGKGHYTSLEAPLEIKTLKFKSRTPYCEKVPLLSRMLTNSKSSRSATTRFWSKS